jgi:hypothetical protein
LAEPLNLTTLTIQFGLIGIDLPLLIRLLDFLPLKLVADQRACAQSQRAANCSARAWGTYRGANNAANCGAAEGADTRAFFSRRQATSGTTHD